MDIVMDLVKTHEKEEIRKAYQQRMQKVYKNSIQAWDQIYIKVETKPQLPSDLQRVTRSTPRRIKLCLTCDEHLDYNGLKTCKRCQDKEKEALMAETEEEYLGFKLLSKKAFVPEKAHSTDAGYDLRTPENFFILPNHQYKVDLKVAFEIPPTTYLQLAERSSHANQGIKLLGGVIDSGFNGSIQALL